MRLSGAPRLNWQATRASYRYGDPDNGNDTFALPLVTLLDAHADAALSLVLSPEDPQLELHLGVQARPPTPCALSCAATAAALAPPALRCYRGGDSSTQLPARRPAHARAGAA